MAAAVDPPRWRGWRGWADAALLVLILGLYAVHFLHLPADFPNSSPLKDWAKFTDEGWYANAAIRHYLWGHWYLPGDFNPAVALPVWPLLLGVVFHFTGVSMLAARTAAVLLFGITLALTYLLVRGWEGRTAALAVVALAAASPFLYSFERLAILEPLLLCITTAAMAVASARGDARLSPRFSAGTPVLLGVLLGTMVLTKTTAIFLFPPILYLLWSTRRGRPRTFLLEGGLAIGTGALLVATYYVGFVRHGYRADFFYLFHVNDWGHPASARQWASAAWLSFTSLLWPGPSLALLTLASVGVSLLPGCRRLWSKPLFPASLLAIGSLFLFVLWHNNQQPRYYLPLAIPYCTVIVLAVSVLRQRGTRWGAFGALVLVGCGLVEASVTLGYALHPQYTWYSTAREVAGYIDQHPGPRRLLLSVSGDEISLMTGLPAICDDFGTEDLPNRMDQYRPGWFAAWDDVDAGTLADIHAGSSRLERVASFRAFNDPDRSVLYLYRMLPEPGADLGVVVDAPGP